MHYDGTLSNCHYINKRESSRTHVRVEFLSPHANIYESTHAHYDRTISTCILLINENQVAYMWGWNVCPLMRTFTRVGMCTMMERYLPAFIYKRKPRRISVPSCTKRFSTKLQTCGCKIGSGKVLKVKELLIRLAIMGAITGEMSFRILALTLSQPGALFEGRLLIILCTSPVVMG